MFSDFQVVRMLPLYGESIWQTKLHCSSTPLQCTPLQKDPGQSMVVGGLNGVQIPVMNISHMVPLGDFC